MSPPTGVHGLLLAAGAGTRAGGPKALRHDHDGTSWLRRAALALRQGGCRTVTVVLGAAASEAADILRPLRDERIRTVTAASWSDGLASSLRTGLADVPADSSAVCVHLVDLPDVGPEVIARVVRLAHPERLARAVYAGRPGHPVLIGRDHVGSLADQLVGDQGARGYLATHQVRLVECSDLATGRDLDTPARPG